jgi:hypothetical protein
MRNFYFSQQVRSEQNLYEDIIIESLKIYGQDVYYLPRAVMEEDRILGDAIISRFSASYKIEMYVENTEGFDGEGDLFTRFGVEIRDEATFIVSRRRWKSVIASSNNSIINERPKEGDLIYLPLSKSLFEIMHVEHEQPFYQLSNLPTYKMRCTLFEYSDEDLDTGIQDIDIIEFKASYKYLVAVDLGLATVSANDIVTQTLDSDAGLIIQGEISGITKDISGNDVLELVHVGANDGEYHTFSTTRPIVIDGVSYSVISVNEENDVSNNEQNDDFSEFTDDFLDFTENNPFGDPENQ